jgi:phenylpropionate dioxygenase-like ring-hydroxylating dioxygenase large terminal subunit
MKRAKEIQTIQKIFKELEAQKNKTAVDGSTWAIPAKRYTSTDQLAVERQVILQNFPIVVGVAAELEKAGDYFLNDQSGMPIMVVKGKDQKIRAFLNICRHRGVRLLDQEKGHIRKNIVCPYHAWSYDDKGCLNRIFHPEAFSEADKAAHNLIELDCQVRIGLIFVVPNPKLKGQYNIDTYLKEVFAVTEGFGLENWLPFKKKTSSYDFNWKLGVEAGVEAYHFKIAHAKSLGPFVFDCGGVVLDENKLHCTTIYPKTSILKLKDQPQSNWHLTQHGNVLIHIFPNTTLLIMEDHAMVIPFFPVEVTKSIAKSTFLIAEKAETEAQKKHFQRNYDIFWGAIDEDNEMTRLQQVSFNGYDDFDITVGGYETLIIQFENLVQDAINEKLQLRDFQ